MHDWVPHVTFIKDNNIKGFMNYNTVIGHERSSSHINCLILTIIGK